jgi:hypothetical protein
MAMRPIPPKAPNSSIPLPTAAAVTRKNPLLHKDKLAGRGPSTKSIRGRCDHLLITIAPRTRAPFSKEKAVFFSYSVRKASPDRPFKQSNLCRYIKNNGTPATARQQRQMTVKNP